MPKKTWNEKLNNSKNLPQVVEIPNCAYVTKHGPKMLVAPPLAYDAIMKQIPKGKVITIDRIRTYLAKMHNADWTCFMTAQMFCNIAAHASDERPRQIRNPILADTQERG